MKNKLRTYIAAVLISLGAIIAVPAAYAKTTLLIVRGSGEFQSLESSVTVTAAEPITLQWTTDESGVTGGEWRVTNAGNNKLVASGSAGPAPATGHFARFTIAANAFLSPSAPASPINFSITIVPQKSNLVKSGAPSSPITVEQVPNGPPQPPVNFGSDATYPSLEIVKYDEQVGIVPISQLHFAKAVVKVRMSNKGKKPTAPVLLGVKDDNLLMRQTSAVSVASLKPGESQIVTVDLNAILPAPKSQMPQEQQYSAWNQQYGERCGVDLKVVMDWKGPQAQTPLNDHNEAYLYQGYGSSKPWQEGRDLSDTQICDGKNCVSLNKVARSIYKQIGCKVVGYAFFVGDRVSGPRGRFDSFGLARKVLNPPMTDFSPTTKMQIASSSKVLTGITAIKVMGSKIDDPAYKNFPSNWLLPQVTIVKNITSRELVSQTSGIQQYYAGKNGQDFATLQTFFTQPVSTPNAAPTCPGAAADPVLVSNPIVMNKKPCYTDTNFGVMRLVLPRAAGANTNDPLQLAQKYVQQVQDNVFKPVGVTDVACKPPASGNHALLYSWARPTVSVDWKDTTLNCGDWGWYVSVEDYAKVLVSLNSGDHKILSDAEFTEMETTPASHPIGFDITTDGTGRRWLEKNGAQGGNCDANKKNSATQTTSVGIFGGASGSNGKPAVSGVAGVLFLNSDIAGQPKAGAWSVLLQAFRDSVTPKP